MAAESGLPVGFTAFAAAEPPDAPGDRFQLLFDRGDFLLVVAAVGVLAFALPAGRRSQLRGPILLLLGYLVLLLLRQVSPEDAAYRSLLAGGVSFFLASAAGITLIHLLVLLLERVRRPLSRIAHDLLQLGLFCAVFVGVLYRGGVDPSTLLTSSAVLTAVIGLALRDTLGNLIAGLTFQMQPPFQVGDWIQFDQLPQNIGRITEINWRATKLVTNEEVEVVVPNGQLALAVVRNFTRPSPSVMRSVFVRVPFDVPPELVRRVVLAAVADVPGVCRQPGPSVMTNGFTDSGTEFWVRVFTTDFANRIKLESDVRDRVWYAFARHGIAIPTATHAVTITAAPPDGVATAGTRQELLLAVPIFAVLPEDAIRRLAASARVQLYAPGEAIIRQGDAGDGLYLIERGEVAVTARAGDAPAVELARLRDGAFFGEMSLLTGEPRSATATAVGECRLLLVDKAALGPILAQHPEFGERMGRVLLERKSDLRSRFSDRASGPDTDLGRSLFQRIRAFFSQ